jgi:hypothetical protein
LSIMVASWVLLGLGFGIGASFSLGASERQRTGN